MDCYLIIKSIQNKNQNKIMYGQQSGDEFQTHQAEVLTYCFSSNVNPSATNTSARPKKKNQQKLTLNIVQPLKTIREQSIQSPYGKLNKRSMYTNQGRIIKIGDAIFKSNFQCGSLGEVSQLKGQNTYLIKLDKQPNSNRPTAWFYFRCEGLRGEVNFIISGFTKSTSLYSEGMKICCREIRKDDQHQNIHLTNNKDRLKSDWGRGGSRISYCANFDPQSDQTIFELKFTYNFVKLYEEKEFPTVQFAYCFPYQFKRINLLARNMVKRDCAILQSLGKTYQGREIPLLTIGNPNAQKSIVLSARVHPGQTVGSFIMEGFLKELTSNSQFANSLKEKYLFKIVPMINPDGVVKGNYRFSGAGYDLNRRWKHCYESSHPEIYYLKNMIKKLHKQKKVIMYIDIHGHSRKKSAFFYGCCPVGNKDFLNVQVQNAEQQSMTRPKQFPFLMSKLNHNFKYDYCTFNMSKDKQGTARIQMWKELHIDHVYTLESSFCGNADNGNNYCEEDFLKMGKSLLEGISVYFYQKNSLSARQNTMCESLQNSTKIYSIESKQKMQKSQNAFDKFINILHKAKQELKTNPTLMNVGMTESDSGSDSEPQAGIIPQDQREAKSITLILDQKTQHKTRQKNQEQVSKERSPKYFKNNKSIKISVRQQNNRKRNRLTPQQLKFIVDQRLEVLKNQQEEKKIFHKQVITMTVNNFYSHNSQQLDSLTSQSLMKKNERVHSKQGNTKSMLQKLKSQRLNSENPISNKNTQAEKEDENEEDDKRKLQIMTRNLLKTREGVQYRRVKKMAEEMKKKHSTSMTTPTFQEPPMPMVRGIVTVNNELNLSKRRMKSIAPSFYPQSQQKNRKFSVQMAYRNNSFRNGKIPIEIANKRFIINGDDIHVHCKGTKIYM